jgi:hypothetical protein
MFAYDKFKAIINIRLELYKYQAAVLLMVYYGSISDLLYVILNQLIQLSMKQLLAMIITFVINTPTFNIM